MKISLFIYMNHRIRHLPPYTSFHDLTCPYLRPVSFNPSRPIASLSDFQAVPSQYLYVTCLSSHTLSHQERSNYALHLIFHNQSAAANAARTQDPDPPTGSLIYKWPSALTSLWLNWQHVRVESWGPDLQLPSPASGDGLLQPLSAVCRHATKVDRHRDPQRLQMASLWTSKTGSQETQEASRAAMSGFGHVVVVFSVCQQGVWTDWLRVGRQIGSQLKKCRVPVCVLLIFNTSHIQRLILGWTVKSKCCRSI